MVAVGVNTNAEQNFVVEATALVGCSRSMLEPERDTRCSRLGSWQITSVQRVSFFAHFDTAAEGPLSIFLLGSQ